jgi:hypothetical protein
MHDHFPGSKKELSEVVEIQYLIKEFNLPISQVSGRTLTKQTEVHNLSFCYGDTLLGAGYF